MYAHITLAVSFGVILGCMVWASVHDARRTHTRVLPRARHYVGPHPVMRTRI